MNIEYSKRLGSCNPFGRHFAQRYQSQLEMNFKIRANTSKRIFNPGKRPSNRNNERKILQFSCLSACLPGEKERKHGVWGVGGCLVLWALKWFMDWPKTPSNLWAKLFHVLAVLVVVLLLRFGRIFQLMPAGVGFKCMHTHICSSHRICTVMCVSVCALCIWAIFWAISSIYLKPKPVANPKSSSFFI